MQKSHSKKLEIDTIFCKA